MPKALHKQLLFSFSDQGFKCIRIAFRPQMPLGFDYHSIITHSSKTSFDFFYSCTQPRMMDASIRMIAGPLCFSGRSSTIQQEALTSGAFKNSITPIRSLYILFVKLFLIEEEEILLCDFV